MNYWDFDIITRTLTNVISFFENNATLNLKKTDVKVANLDTQTSRE